MSRDIACYIAKRLLLLLLTLWLTVSLVFFLIRAIPGDPMQAQLQGAGRTGVPDSVLANMKAKYGLDKPLLLQYAVYLRNVLRGDFGESIQLVGRSINTLIAQYGRVSAELNLYALLFTLLLGVGAGLLAAFRRGRPVDFLIMFVAVLGISLPSMVLAPFLQYWLGVRWRLLPLGGWQQGFSLKHLSYVVLPVALLTFGGVAGYARYIRSSVLDTLHQDYVFAARARGVSGVQTAVRHVLRNAWIPIITFLGSEIAGLMVGSLIIERIFSIPGLGSTYVDAISARDYTVVMGLSVVLSVIYLLTLLLVDLCYLVADPRIVLTSRRGGMRRG